MRISDLAKEAYSHDDTVLRRWISFVVGVGIIGSLVSIALSYVLFGVVLLLWIIHCVKLGTLHVKIPGFFAWIGAFVLASVISIIFSSDIMTSLPSLGKHIRFLWVPMIFTYLGRRHVENVLKALFIVMGISATYAILQYFWLWEVDLLHRIQGFMGHWMTFSGQLMLCSVALTGYLLYRLNPNSDEDQESLSKSESHKFFSGAGSFCIWILLLTIMIFTLVLTQTRSSWLGTLCGFFILLWVYRKKWIVPGIVLVVVIFFASPETYKQRLYSSFDPNDTTTQIRLELLKTGRNIVADHPWIGLGPRTVPKFYRDYNETDDFPEWIYQHLHNNFVQIAAEMGLITVILWMALWIRLVWDFISFARQSHYDGFAVGTAVGSIAVLVAFLAAGFLEYNFGDSEILILLLFFLTIPYVVNNGQE
ncbi:MAG: O-antigen ligase family protein [Acidobacteriota bacterium]|nr:O-antigen ligase family protein [Acidobacteriota bacterium]